MTCFILFLCVWLLPLYAIASSVPEVALRLVEGTYRPGDIIELQAEMRGVDYAEFELNVPANTQLHLVTQTREPVRYVEGVYEQRVLLQLQPLSVGEFDLNGIAVTIAQDGVTRDIALAPVSFTVASYGAEDTSEAVAELEGDVAGAKLVTKKLRISIGVLFVILIVIWSLLRKVNAKPVENAEIKLGLSDLIDSLQGGSELTSMMIAEQLLERADLSMSSALRQHLEAAVYANRLDSVVLLQLLREEAAR